MTFTEISMKIDIGSEVVLIEDLAAPGKHIPMPAGEKGVFKPK